MSTPSAVGGHTRRRRLGTAAGVAIALAIPPGAAIAVDIDYSLNAGVERNDNVTLVELDPIEEDIFRAGLDFALTHDTSTIQTIVAGRAEYRNYLDNTFADTVDGLLAGYFNWVAIPQRLSFTVEDSLTVQPVNTLAANTPGNRQQVNVLSLGPNLYFDLSNSLRGQAELRYSSSDAEISDEFNSQRLGLAVRTVKELGPTSQLSLNLQAQRVDFDDDVVARDYSRQDIFGRYARELSHFTLGLDAGYSRLSYKSGGDVRAEPLLRANIDWLPNETHRFSLTGSQQFSDAATDALTGIGEDSVTVPGQLLVSDSVVNASPFKERRVSLGYSFRGSRLVMLIEPYLNNLDYVDADAFDQEGHGGTVSATWQLRPRISIGAFATLDHIDYSQLGIQLESRRYGVHLQQTFSRHWSGRIEGARQERRSTLAGDNADQNMLFVSITYHR